MRHTLPVLFSIFILIGQGLDLTGRGVQGAGKGLSAAGHAAQHLSHKNIAKASGKAVKATARTAAKETIQLAK